MTTAPTITPAAVSALAALVHEFRPDWDRRGIAAAIHHTANDGIPGPDLAFAFIRGAVDPANETPAALTHLNNRAWASDWYLPCKTHPHCRARRPNGQCADCWTDQHEDPNAGQCRDRGGKPIPDLARDLIGQVIRRPSPREATEPCNPEEVAS